ncbi:ATP-binding protein [Candidatus Poriferisodalis sp.]|uniref:ATP-binding protein n=1 Tax=Candidatus Poriferisodalis sp. TaxID=3101277 RepID=UPI003B02D1A9
MVVDRLVPRLAQQRLREALADSPVVFVHGPRQCGKTTLTQMTCAPSALERGARSRLRSTTSTEAHISGSETHAYITFDDLTVVEAARSDPMGFVDRLPPRVVLDEVQRVPELYTAIKLAVDRDRSPGRFVLTGSTNLLLMPTLADSLVGRMQIVRMHPLTQRELSTEAHAGDAQADETGVLPREGADFLDSLFSGGFSVTRVEPERSRLADRIAAGGYPAAVARPAGARRLNWYSDYLTSVIQRDLPNISRVRVPDALSRLLEVCATQTASLLNVSNLASQLQISRPTVTEYLSALERLFLVDRLRPWHSNRSKRIIKTPKLHLGDAGLACALLGVSAADIYQDRKLLGQLTETLVYSELRSQANAHPAAHRLFHFRDRDGVEVDLVIERGAHRVGGIDIKASATATPADFRGLRRLAAASGDRFVGGAVIYDGEIAASFGDRLWALPISSLWSPDFTSH